MSRPLHFSAFVMNTTPHIIQGLWRRRRGRQMITAPARVEPDSVERAPVPARSVARTVGALVRVLDSTKVAP